MSPRELLFLVGKPHEAKDTDGSQKATAGFIRLKNDYFISSRGLEALLSSDDQSQKGGVHIFTGREIEKDGFGPRLGIETGEKSRFETGTNGRCHMAFRPNKDGFAVLLEVCRLFHKASSTRCVGL